MDKLTNEQIQLMINRYIRNKLESWERKRIEDGPFEIEDLNFIGYWKKF